ncbi:hypothetical protein MTO96_026184 [Rhipicephalus appendiculatus]
MRATERGGALEVLNAQTGISKAVFLTIASCACLRLCLARYADGRPATLWFEKWRRTLVESETTVQKAATVVDGGFAAQHRQEKISMLAVCADGPSFTPIYRRRKTDESNQAAK